MNHNDIVTILILVDGFLQSLNHKYLNQDCPQVTILILVDGFLQLKSLHLPLVGQLHVTILILVDGFLQLHNNIIIDGYSQKSQSLFQQMVFCNKEDGIIKTYNLLESQSLFQQMVFCNMEKEYFLQQLVKSQSLFQQMVFCNSRENFSKFHFFMQKTCIQ